MSWQIVVALIIAIPVIMLPVALVWYLNIGGLFSAARELRAQRSALKTRETVRGE